MKSFRTLFSTNSIPSKSEFFDSIKQIILLKEKKQNVPPTFLTKILKTIGIVNQLFIFLLSKAKKHPHFKLGYQQDSHEFLGILLNTLKEDFDNENKEKKIVKIL